MSSGWWELTLKIDGAEVGSDDVSDATIQHIAEAIKEGYECGSIEEEDDEEDEDEESLPDEEDIELLASYKKE